MPLRGRIASIAQLHQSKHFITSQIILKVVIFVIVVVLVFCPWLRLHKVSSIFILMLHTKSSQGYSYISSCVSSNAVSIHFYDVSFVCERERESERANEK